MDVEVIDNKTGAVRKMAERFAKILVGLKHVRWPEPVVGQYQTKVMEAGETIMEVEETPEQQPAQEQATQQPEQQPAIIRRGRKPKFRG